jgi:probable HAF family extracellular repeat protein
VTPAPGSAFAADASADGSVIVGQSSSPNGQFEAFRWTEAGMVGLGDLPGGLFQSFASAVSGDGSIVVGESAAGGSGNDAFLWDEAHGMRFLIDVLEEQGLDMTGWRLRTATGISNDGTTITGTARDPSDQAKGYVAVIPEPERASMLLSGALALVLLRRRRARREFTN